MNHLIVAIQLGGEAVDDKKFTVELPMPPSVNSIYFVKAGRKHLTSKGKAMKVKIKSLTMHAALPHVWLGTVKDTALRMKIDLFFDSVQNKGWPKKAKSRYKRIDITNRVKLLEDAVSEALGIDDSLFFHTTITKNEGKERACVTITYHHEQDGAEATDATDGDAPTIPPRPDGDTGSNDGTIRSDACESNNSKSSN